MVTRRTWTHWLLALLCGVCALLRPASAEVPQRSLSAGQSLPPLSLSSSTRPRSARRQQALAEDEGEEEGEEEEEEADEFSSDYLPTTHNRTLSADYLRRTLRLQETGVEEEPLEIVSPSVSSAQEQQQKKAPQRMRVDSALRRLLRRFEKQEKQERRSTPVRSEEEEPRTRSLSQRLSTLSHTLTHTLPQATRYVFSQRIYKGTAVSFVKSAHDLRSGGFGLKIPITNHFPLYDSNVFLPRVVGFVGVNIPLSYKVAFTVSVPIQAVQIFLLYLLQYSPELWPKMLATDNVKRVGFSWAAKLPAHRRGRSWTQWWRATTSSTVGVFNFVPGSRLVAKLLPLILVTPSLCLALLLYAFAITAALVPALREALPLPSWRIDGEAENNTAENSNSLENTLMRRFDDAWLLVSRVLKWKTLALGSTGSFTRKSLSVSLNMDFAPFYLLQLKALVMFLLVKFPKALFAACETFVDAVNALHRRGERALQFTRPRNPSALSFERVGSYSDAQSSGTKKERSKPSI